jgi:hypothetical protein
VGEGGFRMKTEEIAQRLLTNNIKRFSIYIIQPGGLKTTKGETNENY